MRTFVVDFTVLEDDDFSGVPNRAESVRNNENCLANYELVEGLLDFPFAFGIQCRGGFVEDEDRRIFQESASDRDALLLSAG